ncbi:gephyrin-like molybdotransferase receptor GlpR [Corynebacterium nuruki]|uniref:divisome protein SepX/GlpR n=1 Tax=Corynebacterium nuruki TaxID=1032851 RepID=UPI0039BFC494
MSGSLSSVILIAVVWLLLLTPLFLRRHQPVRRTSKALSETRVLHEGGTGIERPHRRPLPAESLYHADPDEDIELVDAEPEQVLIDDTPDAAERAVPTRVIDGEVVGYRPLDDEDTGEFPPVEVDSDDDVVAVRELGGEVTVVVAEDADTDDTDDADDADDAEDTDTADDTEDADGTAEDRPDFADVPVAYFRGGDTDVSVGTDDTVVERAGLPAVREPEQPEELTDEDLAYAAAHRGRGFYDPVTSQQLAERRQTRRRRTLAGLGVLLVLAVVGGVFVGGAAWAAVVVMAALTGVYLYYLRRQTVEEQELRHRRIARMRRARAGVRSTDDSELGVPDRLLRPGAVALEIDDDAPEFAALPVGDYVGDDSCDGRGGYDDRRSYRAV